MDRLSVCGADGDFANAGLLRAAAAMENVLFSDTGIDERPRVVGEGGGSVCDLMAIGLGPGSSSSSSTVKDCLSFDGDVIGEGPDLLGGVDGLPMTVVGDDGEEGLRKGEVRGELNDKGEGLYAEACTMHCKQRSTVGSLFILPYWLPVVDAAPTDLNHKCLQLLSVQRSYLAGQ